MLNPVEFTKPKTIFPPRRHIILFIAVFSGWLVLQLAGVGFREGLELGIYSLFVFIALGCSLYQSFSPAPPASTGRNKICIILYAFPLIVLTRYVHMNFLSYDYTKFLSAWYDYIQKNGLAAYKDRFADYAPFYTYMLGAPALLLPAANSLITIKMISFVGEAVAALFVYLIVGIKYGRKSRLPLLAALMFLLLPTVVINSAMIAQCDVWYMAFLLGCIYYAVGGRPLFSMSFFAFAFALKLQTIFLSPFMLILVLNRKIPWYYLALVPIAYLVICLPAWLEGRSWSDLATIYVYQTGEGIKLARHAPTLYAAIPKHFKFIGVAKWAGIVLTVTLMAIFAFRNKNALKEQSTIENYVFLALASVALSAFFLPKMQDRYFFPADVLSLLIAFLMPRFWFLPVLYQLISGFSVLKINDPHYFLSHHFYTFVSAILANTAVSIWLYRTGISRTFFCQRKNAAF